LPLTWSEQEHVKWKTAIPGEGWSSPVVEGNQVWMQTALDKGKSLRAVCVERETGRIQHDIELFYIENPERKHAFNSFASPTPVIENGGCMLATACTSCLRGRLERKNSLEEHRTQTRHDKNGPGSSPILYRDLFILNCDGTEARYVAAVNKLTGKVVWKTERSTRSTKRRIPKSLPYSPDHLRSWQGPTCEHGRLSSQRL